MTGVQTVEQLRTVLKEKFYDVMIFKPNQSFEGFISNISNQLKEIMGVKLSKIYLLNESTQHYQLFSTQSDYPVKKVAYTAQEFEKLIQENGTDYPNGDDLFFKPVSCTSTVLIPLHMEKENDGFILFLLDEETPYHHSFFNETVEQTSKIIQKMNEYFQSINEETKYERLYQVTSKFYSTMNIEDVLREVIRTLKDLYTKLDFHLLLTQDNLQIEDLPINELPYDKHEKDAGTTAFLTGQIQFEDMSDHISSLYAPLVGRQGTYGVLQVLKPKHLFFQENDIEFISILAKTAGNALENAQLHQQSRRHITDLQLINQSSQTLNSKQTLSDTFSYLEDLMMSTFKAEEVGFILYDEKQQDWNKYRVLNESTSFFFTEEGEWFLSFLNKKIEQKVYTIFIGDFNNNDADMDIPYKSVMAVPMIHDEKVIGLVMVLHPNEYFFSFETYKLLQSLVQHSALTVVNYRLKEELEQLVRTDYLTKLYSRNYLDKMMNKHLEVGKQGTFLLIDIDNFKQINDEYGHDVGDEIICQVAEIIRANIRSHDVAARWGGEELAIYLPNTTMVLGQHVAERLVKTVSEKTQPKVTISCGVSYWGEKFHGKSKSLFLRADQALYIAKKQGKNRVVKQTEIII
ncbi:diguanylate cyclase (GGDEF) domain-containing protein [Salinibacillus kushneri]|uniref:Diguanylate cyclase (GGDEF) domain-containing protein n=1 Tax=Salinibacillus kushneri TaxID=237682 RepID=A0A1I0H9W4_9BACI|nr:diguanylate cyclase [Salinibacillus kushneri]SET80566.1 diguanylate cyclase (GGDEF) domain-containing protein [Salinibacillus kushneri]